MSLVEANARMSELAELDVLDVLADGTLRLNPDFVAECRARFDADASCLDTVFQERILARALERGYAGVVDLDGLTLAALEVAANAADKAEA